MQIRKQHAAPSSNELAVIMHVNGKDKPLGTNIKTLVQSLTDYSKDALEKVNKHLEKMQTAVLRNISKIQYSQSRYKSYFKSRDVGCCCRFLYFNS